jgi:energy-coupling factor transporter ATP-binding protein EcfA2
MSSESRRDRLTQWLTEKQLEKYIPPVGGMGIFELPSMIEQQGNGHVFWDEGFPALPCSISEGHLKIGPPSITNRRLVLIGNQGVGKTTLFNKLTGLQHEVSGDCDSCTRDLARAPCREPFEKIEIVDTPGLGHDGIAHRDCYQLREALIRKPINQLVVVASLPNNARTSALTDAVQPIDTILKCHTFKVDPHDGVAHADCSGATKVFLVFTHREDFARSVPPGTEWTKRVEAMRKKFSWVGSVAMIDEGDSVEWLLRTLVISAACEPTRDFSIPMPEFNSRFPIARILPEFDSRIHRQSPLEAVNEKCEEFKDGMESALSELGNIIKERGESTAGSSGFVEKLGPSVDAILRFLDDLFERKTLEVVGKVEGIKVDEIFSGTDETVNGNRVRLWNAVKNEMSFDYTRYKRKVFKLFPDRPENAVYKKCNHCPAVYWYPPLPFPFVACPAFSSHAADVRSPQWSDVNNQNEWTRMAHACKHAIVVQSFHYV